MDLRNLSSTPSQLEAVLQRRPSLSSLSSASGYTSSNYNGPQPNSNVVQSNQPQSEHSHHLGQQKLAVDSHNNRMFSEISSNSSSSNLTAPATSSIPAVQVASNVVPWVEQQKQQQSLTVNSLDNGKKQNSKQQPLSESSPNATPVPSSISMSGANTSSNLGDDDDELIPTAIVIKNIPFAIKKEQLLDVMTKLNLPLPYAFNYHFDNGVFRGLAFANFTSTDETSMVVNQLNGREIGGRKLRVEYKKMLPLQERERIEREKREKRGQLEEQHRSASNASLASLISAASTTAATKNLSVNGQSYNTQTERVLMSFPLGNVNIPPPPVELNFNEPDVLELYSQLLTYRDDNSKLIFELAFPANINLHHRKVLSLLCNYLNLLELYDNGYIIIRRKPGQQSIQQRQQQSATFNPHLHHQSTGVNAQQPTPGISNRQQVPVQPSHSQASQPQAPQSQTPQQQNGHPHHSNSMMNMSQLPALLGNYPPNLQTPNPHAPELLRSQSQSALPLVRLRQQASTPVQQQYAQYQGGSTTQKPISQAQQPAKYQTFGYGSGAPGGQQVSQLSTPTSSSAAALLRSSNNRSFVDVRSTPPLASALPGGQSVNGSPTPQHPSTQTPQIYPAQSQSGTSQYFNQGSQISQPGTPSVGNDLSNRFAPFGQHTHLTGSFTSLQPPSANSDDFSLNDPLGSKFNSLNLGNGFDQPKTGSGIWGSKK